MINIVLSYAFMQSRHERALSIRKPGEIGLIIKVGGTKFKFKVIFN